MPFDAEWAEDIEEGIIMIQFFRLCLAATVGMIAFAPLASAEDSPCPATAGSPLCALHDAAGQDGVVQGESEMVQLVRLLGADGKYDENDRLLLQLLSDAKANNKVIDAPITGDGVFHIQPPDDDAIATLRFIKTPIDSDAALTGNDIDLRKLVRLYSLASGPISTDAMLACARKLDEKFQISRLTNGHKPMREQINDWYAMIKPWPDDLKSQGRSYFHACAQRVDEYRNDAVPDFIYEWLKP